MRPGLSLPMQYRTQPIFIAADGSLWVRTVATVRDGRLHDRGGYHYADSFRRTLLFGRNAGRSDVPLVNLGFRCSYGGHRVIAAKDSVKRLFG